MAKTMRTIHFCALAAGFVLTALPSRAQSIAVPNFGTDLSAVGIDEQYLGYTFGQNNGWTVIASPVDGASSTVETIGNYWQSPDGNVTVDMDGISVGAIDTTIAVPTAGLVSVGFYLAGNPQGGPPVKDLQVQLGSAAAQDFTFNTTGYGNGNMGWIAETAVFDITTPGNLVLSFDSLDAAPSDWGPVLGTVTANETTANAPDNGSSLLLLAVASGGILIYRRRLA